MSGSIEKQKGSAITCVISDAHPDFSSQAFVVGVLYESDEWSDQKMAATSVRQVENGGEK